MERKMQKKRNREKLESMGCKDEGWKYKAKRNTG